MAGIAALAVAYVLSQFYRSFLAVLTPALTDELGASKLELSIASGAWFAAFALMQFVVGVSLDRYGPRRTAAILLALCGGGGAFVFAGAASPPMIVLGMTLIGAGCAPVLISTVFIFARSFSAARLAVLTSCLIGVGSLGNILGASPLAAAAEALGWRPVMAGLGCITVLVAIALFLLVRDPERAKGAESAGFSGFIQLFKVRALWPLLLLVGLNYAPAIGIRGLWAGPFLSDVYGADALLIGEVTLFMALAMSAGNFIYGPLDTIFRTRKWVAVVGNTLGVLVLAWLALFPAAGILEVAAAMVLIGLCGGSYAVLLAHGRSFLPADLTGRGVTLLNFFSIGGVGVMQAATGAVVSASTVPGEPSAAYSWLFGFYALMLGIGVAVYLLSRDAPPEGRQRAFKTEGS